MSGGYHQQGGVRTSKKPRKPRRVIIYILAFLALVSGYAFYSSAYFRVETFEVQGVSRLQPDEVIQASGIIEGTSLFALRVAEVRERLEALPYVRRAEIARVFPSKVTIAIEERTPVGYLLSNGEFMAVDREGFILESWEGAFFLDEPLLTGDFPQNLEPGYQVYHQMAQAATQFLGLFAENRDRISEVNVNESGLTLYTLEGVPIFLGMPDATMEEKVLLLQGILEDVAREGMELEYIDLRSAKPVVRPKGGSTPRPSEEEPLDVYALD